jgi:3-hydroxy-9,10-secoandrosta-1,3,5(10)-triene-9,17-dione monooxygenase
MAQAQTDHNFDPVLLATELRPLLARNAARAERDRRLPAENVEALQAANLFKVMVPRRWGGYRAPLKTVLGAFAELARGCGSSGWVTMIINGVNWWASSLPDRGQEEIFADTAVARVCAAGTPACKGQRVQGGVRISGKFPFASGCLHSSWGGLSVEVEDDAHNVVDLVTAFAPMSELEIEDTWFVAGMCGTGSNTLVAKDVFVPDHRVLAMSKILKGERLSGIHSGEPSDNYTWTAANNLIGIAPVIGIAQAMLEKVIEGTNTRGITFTTYSRQADAPVVQHQIAGAALKIDSAWLLAMRSADEIEAAAVAGNQMDYLARARVRGVVGYAAKLVREAVDTLASIGGAHAFADASPLQRMWRDANIAARHVLLATDPALEIYGRALLGVEGNITPLI